MQRFWMWALAPLAAIVAIFVLSCSGTKKTSGFNDNGDDGGSGSGLDGSGGNNGDGPTFGPGGGDAALGCVGLQCQAGIDNCTAQGKPATTITGKVYDPAGQLPLYNVYVYIPNVTLNPIVPGNPKCTQCEAPASGSPILGTLTDAKGEFTLKQGAGDMWGVPSGNVPIVVQVGKWRHKTSVNVTACATTTIPDPPTPAQKLRLPAKSSEGDMPLIAFTSGCDPAECFLRHVGIDDSEFVPPTSTTGHVHFYTGQTGSQINGGNQATDTYAWWASSANLLKYDIVFNACECSPYDRGVGSYAAMEAFLGGGGRLFTTHYYYNWFAPPTGPADEQGVVQWALPEGFQAPGSNYFIDTTFPKGAAFADWLQDNSVTTTHGQINLTDTRYDMNATTMESSRWIYNANASTDPSYATMYMSFNTPVTKPVAQQCGRAVFSDVHLSGSSDGSNFPGECANADPDGSHAINEKALEFLFFDLSSCVQDNSQPPPPPPPQ